MEGSQRQVGQTSPNSIVWWVFVGMVFFKVSVGDFWTDAGPSAGPSFMTFLRWVARVAIFTRRTLPRRTLISMMPAISAPSQTAHLGVVDLNPLQQGSMQNFQQRPPQADSGARRPARVKSNTVFLLRCSILRFLYVFY